MPLPAFLLKYVVALDHKEKLPLPSRTRAALPLRIARSLSLGQDEVEGGVRCQVFRCQGIGGHLTQRRKDAKEEKKAK